MLIKTYRFQLLKSSPSWNLFIKRRTTHFGKSTGKKEYLSFLFFSFFKISAFKAKKRLYKMIMKIEKRYFTNIKWHNGYENIVLNLVELSSWTWYTRTFSMFLTLTLTLTLLIKTYRFLLLNSSQSWKLFIKRRRKHILGTLTGKKEYFSFLFFIFIKISAFKAKNVFKKWLWKCCLKCS